MGNADKHKQMVRGSRKEGIPFWEINEDQGRREWVWAPEKKIFGPRARVDQLKVLTLNWKDWLFVTASLGLKGLICMDDK